MKIINFITGNQSKLKEFRSMLLGYQVQRIELDLEEIQELEPEKIIKHKLGEALKTLTDSIMVEDTSLICHGLGGLPGPFIKWFEQSLSLEKLAKLVLGSGDTSAIAQVNIGLVDSKQETHFFKGQIDGKIVMPRGEGGFGWDKIFVPNGYEKTFGEMANEEKNKISHRLVAVKKLKVYLDENWI